MPLLVKIAPDLDGQALAELAAVLRDSGIDGAIAHIRQYHSQHTNCIITEDDKAAEQFFAELDSGRRERLAAMIADCEQVLITAAVPEDVPEALTGARFTVTEGSVTPA